MAMAVDAEWRRKGIGGRILKFLEEEATTQGVSTYILNAQELAFRNSPGFQGLGSQPGEHIAKMDVQALEQGAFAA